MQAGSWRFLGVVTLCSLMMHVGGDQLWAARPARKPQRAPAAQENAATVAAAATTQQALAREADGDETGCRALIEKALDEDANYAPAHWQLGHVNVDGKWLPVDEATRAIATSGKITEYRNRRMAASNSATDQRALAEWCLGANLPEQARSHWLNATLQESGSSQAVAALGANTNGGAWTDSLATAGKPRLTAQQRKLQTQLKRELKRLQPGFESANRVARQDAIDELARLYRPEMLPMLEEVFSLGNEAGATAMVEVLENLEEQAATNSLIRHAVFSPWEKVRGAAATKLQPRSPFTWVPHLLAGLDAPVVGEVEVLTLPGGTTSRTITLFRDGPLFDELVSQNSTDVIIYHNRGQIAAPPAGAAATGFSRQKGALVDNQLAMRNALIQKLNKRIGEALAHATAGISPSDDKLPIDDPNRWYHWWYDYNDYYYPITQPLVERTSQATNYEYRVGQPVNTNPAPTGSPAPTPTSRATDGGTGTPRISECFPAGTTVWTQTGPLAIDRVQAGDCVLAQEVNSGRLDFKAVLATTIRPATAMLDIRLGKSTIRATRGHPFWVTGLGWQMAKELQVGQRLRTAEGSLTIEAIEKAPPAEAYNLIVADFNSYFVGDERVFVHDNTFRLPTEAIVPGYRPDEAAIVGAP